MKKKTLARVLAVFTAGMMGASALVGCGKDTSYDDDWYDDDEYWDEEDWYDDDEYWDDEDWDDEDATSGNSENEGIIELTDSTGMKKGTGFVAPTFNGKLADDPTRQVAVKRAVRSFVKYDHFGNKLGENFFPYRALLNDRQQSAYDYIYNCLAAGKTEFDMGVVVYTSEIPEVLNAVYYENPEIYWIESSWQWSMNENDEVLSISIESNGLSHDGSDKQKFESAANEIIEKAATIASEAGKIKYVHDQIVLKVDYQLDCAYNQSAYSALVNHLSVCSGYARSFQYILQQLGIPCSTIGGDAGGGHAWDLVLCDGVYYNVDVTWDDPEGNTDNTIYTTYLLVSDAQLSSETAHVRDELPQKLPAATQNYSGEFNTTTGAVSPVVNADNGTGTTTQDNNQTPAQDSTTPEATQPATEDNTPSGNTQTPSTETQTPSGDTQTPSGNTGTTETVMPSYNSKTANGAFNYVLTADFTYDSQQGVYYKFFDNGIEAYYDADYDWYYLYDLNGNVWEYDASIKDFVPYK